MIFFPSLTEGIFPAVQDQFLTLLSSHTGDNTEQHVTSASLVDHIYVSYPQIELITMMSINIR